MLNMKLHQEGKIVVKHPWKSICCCHDHKLAFNYPCKACTFELLIYL